MYWGNLLLFSMVHMITYWPAELTLSWEYYPIFFLPHNNHTVDLMTLISVSMGSWGFRPFLKNLSLVVRYTAEVLVSVMNQQHLANLPRLSDHLTDKMSKIDSLWMDSRFFLLTFLLADCSDKVFKFVTKKAWKFFYFFILFLGKIW